MVLTIGPSGNVATTSGSYSRYVIGRISTIDGYEPLRSKRSVKFLGYTSGPLQPTHKLVMVVMVTFGG